MIISAFAHPAIISGVLLLIAQVSLPSDQIVLRFAQSPTTTKGVVRLEDVVEVISGQSASLTQTMTMPLGPAPRLGQSQVWRSEDILQHLELRGLHTGKIRWSGAIETKLQRVEALDERLATQLTPAFTNDRLLEQASRNVTQVIRDYLNLRSSERIEWRLKFELPVQSLPLLNIRRNIVSIGGGSPPWLGEQQFVLQVKQFDSVLDIPIEATVELPPMVVIATRPIRRQEVVTEELLDFAPLSEQDEQRGGKFFERFEDCVGKQTSRSIGTGQVLTMELLGEPIVVRRNDVVEIESVSGAIVVRAAAKSLGSGAVGDLIQVELPGTRQRLHATVVGQGLVRVAAVAGRTASR